MSVTLLFDKPSQNLFTHVPKAVPIPSYNWIKQAHSEPHKAPLTFLDNTVALKQLQKAHTVCQSSSLEFEDAFANAVVEGDEDFAHVKILERWYQGEEPRQSRNH